MFRVVSRKVQFSISRDIMLVIPVDSHRLGANICQQSGRDFHSQDGLSWFSWEGKKYSKQQLVGNFWKWQWFCGSSHLRTHLSWQDWWSSNSHGTSWTSSVTRSLIPNLPGEMLPKYMGTDQPATASPEALQGCGSHNRGCHDVLHAMQKPPSKRSYLISSKNCF